MLRSGFEIGGYAMEPTIDGAMQICTLHIKHMKASAGLMDTQRCAPANNLDDLQPPWTNNLSLPK